MRHSRTTKQAAWGAGQPQLVAGVEHRPRTHGSLPRAARCACGRQQLSPSGQGGRQTSCTAATTTCAGSRCLRGHWGGAVQQVWATSARHHVRSPLPSPSPCRTHPLPHFLTPVLFHVAGRILEGPALPIQLDPAAGQGVQHAYLQHGAQGRSAGDAPMAMSRHH